MSRLFLAMAVILGGLAMQVLPADPPAKKLAPNRDEEPLAATFSMAKGAAFLDAVALDWTQSRKCATCHTNVPHLMARSALGVKSSPQEKQVRTFFEQRVSHWDRGGKGDAPRWDTEVVVTAVALAFHDRATTGKMHPLTRQALDRMWKVQKKEGAWNWLKCEWPPMEHDDYFGAVFAAVGVGIAPENYAAGESARQGLARLKTYLRKTPAPGLHHRAWLLWAASSHEDLMTPEVQKKTVADLLALQRSDGGWSLASLDNWKGYDGRDNDANAPSDGYGTGLIVYLLRQAGLPADHPALKKGAGWLRTNQRESGRYFTRSLNSNRAHYISHAGTAFALLALRACE